jgi:oligopeptide transport system substrate-binding protein
MTRTRNRVRFMATLVALTCFLGACGTDSAQTPASTEPVREGDVFRQGLVRLASEDPAKSQTVSERLLADQLYDGLTSWNRVKRRADPAIAQKWQVSDDQLQWTFDLRADAKATNGETITSADVKRTLEHIARRSTGTLLSETLSPVKGWAELNAGTQQELNGIVIPDEKTVRIDLATPFSELDALLTNPAFGIVHRSADGGSHGTGPYVPAEKSADAWKLRKVIDAKAHLDEIQVSFFADARASYAAFEQGKLDWSPVVPADAEQAGKAHGTALFEPSLRTLSLTFNLASPKFADVRFREAIVRAVDRRAVATKLESQASALAGIVPEGVVAEQGGGCGSQCFADRAKAKQLVKDVFPNGAPAITIDVARGAPFTDPALQQLVADLAEVGVTATIRTTDADKFGAVTVSPDRELFQTSWAGLYPTAGAFIDPLYRSSSPSNVSGLKREEVDRFLEEAFSATDPDQRVDAYRDAETSAMKQLPVLPIAQFPTNSVQSARMRGIAILPTGAFDISNVWAAAPVS